jgi:hypothetical protein
MTLLFETLMLDKTYPILETLGWTDWMLRLIPDRGGRQARQTGGEIIPAHIYRNENK